MEGNYHDIKCLGFFATVLVRNTFSKLNSVQSMDKKFPQIIAVV